MVTGNGMIAKSFYPYLTKNDFLIFASGVSDSKSSRENDFDREYQLLKTTIDHNQEKTIIYFSTCSIYDADLAPTPYVQHKINMENLIKSSTPSFYIFRLSNLAGFSNNPNTVLNFFYFHISGGRHFYLWKNSQRNIIDVQDVYHTVDYILSKKLFLNQVVNIANKHSYPVDYIVRCMEEFTRKKADYTATEKGARLLIDVSRVEPLFDLLTIRFAENYLEQLLVKYYPQHDL
jgi:nucleoside-diphosphate-sugar epimerase